MNEITKEKDFCDECFDCKTCPLVDKENCYDIVEKLYKEGYEIVKKQQGYKFNIPVGDWSDDGHGKCSYYLVESNKPVEEVRESHFKIKEITDVDIDNLCRQYGDSSIDEDDYETLKNLGFEFNEDDFEDDEDNASVYSSGFAKIWIFLLMQVDKELELKIVPAEECPNLPFYGFDEKGRHISALGYGLFE